MPIYARYDASSEWVCIPCDSACLAVADVTNAFAILTGVGLYYNAKPGQRINGKRIEAIDLKISSGVEMPGFVKNNTRITFRRVPRF